MPENNKKYLKISEKEAEILDYWDKNHCFEKSLAKNDRHKPYVFYDGPPFATGLPHYGHIVASIMKDVIPRFWTMKGYYVERRWGWDCHGLPIENIIEKKLNLKTKKDIEEFGVAKFNNACKETVLLYAQEWKKVIRKIGRWVDMENDYKTMDLQFMESVWWVFKELWKKKLIYKGYKPMHICPRCETPLSNFEVTLEYKEVYDLSVVVKFSLNDFNLINLSNKKIYILAWTTTPWTLPANLLLAVGEDIDYVLVEIEGIDDELYILAKKRIEDVLDAKKFNIIKEFKGVDLRNLSYKPLFPYFSNISDKAFRIVTADFVSIEEGTGVVHIAPGFGEDDYYLGEREGVPVLQHIKMNGHIIEEVEDFKGLEVKPKQDPSSTDAKIINWLEKHNLVFSKQKYKHSYPHCWRCDTPLLNYATESWFVRVLEIKDELLKNNEKINWIPAHIKYGRFGKWLEGARDWAISRNRYWGTPLPLWRCENKECNNIKVIGSRKELEDISGQNVNDLHKHIVDEIVWKCEHCSGQMKRVSEVLDCWFESGSMPYAQKHYPFENKQTFEAGFPAQFIAEGQDQTRGWFYTLHILATALTRGENPSIPGGPRPAFENVIVNGMVLAEDGKKMSKRLRNYPDPLDILDKYGADALRYYLLTSPVMHAEKLNFSEKGVREMYNKVVNTLLNIYNFYAMFIDKDEVLVNDFDNHSLHVLDKWILARLKQLLQEVSQNLESYKLVEASRPILNFIIDLSQWYVRRSRNRFKGDDLEDKKMASQVLGNVLYNLLRIIAPFTPFVADYIYLRLPYKKSISVHLENWPDMKELFPVDHEDQILKEMSKVREIIEWGLSLRAERSIKVRQVLSQFLIKGFNLSEKYLEEYKSIIAEELNVKSVEFVDDFPATRNEWVIYQNNNIAVALNIQISKELRKEGLLRELIRHINNIRKQCKLTLNDLVVIQYNTQNDLILEVIQEFKTDLMKNTLSSDIIKVNEEDLDNPYEIKIGEEKLFLNIIKQ